MTEWLHEFQNIVLPVSVWWACFKFFTGFVDPSCYQSGHIFPGKGFGLGFSLCLPGLWPLHRGRVLMGSVDIGI